MYYNYHAKCKKLILNLELIDYKLLDKYKNISPCLLLIFKNNPPMPIREHKINYYLDLIESIEYYDFITK